MNRNFMPIGRLRSGKDSFFDIANEKFPGKWQRRAFADKLKEMVHKISYLYFDLFNKNEKEHWRLAANIEEFNRLITDKNTMRHIYQQMGTEICREIFGEDCWYNALTRTFRKDENYIVTDCRFHNEWDGLVDDFDFQPVLIFSSVENLWERHLTKFPDADFNNFTISLTHKSEGLFPYVWEKRAEYRLPVIHNNGTFQEFKEKVIDFICDPYDEKWYKYDI